MGDVTYQFYNQLEREASPTPIKAPLEGQQAFMAAVVSTATKYGIAVPDDQTQTRASVARWVREVYNATMSATSVWDGETSHPVPLSAASLKCFDQSSLMADIDAENYRADNFGARTLGADRTTVKDRAITIRDDADDRSSVDRMSFQTVHETQVAEDVLLQQATSSQATQLSEKKEGMQVRAEGESDGEQPAERRVNSARAQRMEETSVLLEESLTQHLEGRRTDAAAAEDVAAEVTGLHYGSEAARIVPLPADQPCPNT